MLVCAVQESASPVLWKFCNQIPLASKVKFPGSSQSLCWIRRLGNLLWALELLQQCKNFFGIIVLQFVGRLLGGSVVVLMVTSSKRTYAARHTSQVGCSQSPCPCGRPLLTPASTGDPQTLKGRPGSVSCGGHCSFPWILMHTRALSAPSQHLWQVWGLILNAVSPILPSCSGFSFVLGCGVSFLGGIQRSPIDGCPAASCDFGVLAEDELTSFYSTILTTVVYLLI